MHTGIDGRVSLGRVARYLRLVGVLTHAQRQSPVLDELEGMNGLIEAPRSRSREPTALMM
jgi:hypothetical protein